MFAFLKKIFGKRKKEAVVVPVGDIDNWFQLQMEERVQGLDGAIQDFYGSVAQVLQRLRGQRSELVAAPIVDEEKVEPRIKSIVQGHRENYCRELGIFINNIHTPTEIDVKKCLDFYRELQHTLDEFSQSTLKSFGASRHLFHIQIDAIAASLKELTDVAAAFYAIFEKQGVIALESIGQRLISVKKEQERRRRLAEDLIMKKTRLEHARKQRSAKDAEILSLRESPEFQSYQQLLEKRDHILDQYNSAERDVGQFFGELERVLRKYEYLSMGDDKLFINKYLQNPRDALLHDPSLAFWDILVRLKNSISSLELKDEEEKKARDRLETITKEQLNSLRQRCLSIMEEKESVLRHIEHNPPMIRLREEEYKRDHFNQQVQRFEKEVAELEAVLQDNSVEQLYHQIEKEITAAVGFSVSITFDS